MTIELNGHDIALGNKSLIVDGAEITLTDENYNPSFMQQGRRFPAEGGVIESSGTPLIIQNNGVVKLDGARISSLNDTAI